MSYENTRNSEGSITDEKFTDDCCRTRRETTTKTQKTITCMFRICLPYKILNAIDKIPENNMVKSC